MSVRWCFIFLKITPLLAPYASDGLNTLHWLSWLNNLGQSSWPKHTHPFVIWICKPTALLVKLYVNMSIIGVGRCFNNLGPKTWQQDTPTCTIYNFENRNQYCWWLWYCKASVSDSVSINSSLAFMLEQHWEYWSLDPHKEFLRTLHFFSWTLLADGESPFRFGALAGWPIALTECAHLSQVLLTSFPLTFWLWMRRWF